MADSSGKFKKGEYVRRKDTGKVGRVIESNEDATVVKWNGSERTVSTPNDTIEPTGRSDSKLADAAAMADALMAKCDSSR